MKTLAIFSQFVLGALAVVVVSTLVTLSNPASAACIGGVNDRNGKPCGGGGDDGDQTPPSNVPIDVRWQGAISEPWRECILESAQSNGEHGNYTCTVGAPPILFNFTGIPRDQVGRNGDASLCALFDGDIELTPSQENGKYVVAWNGNAFSGSSEIHIINWFRPNPLPGIGAIILNAYADVVGNFSDPNPLADPLTMNIDEIQIDFKSDKNNKTLAECIFLPAENEVIFESGPAA